MRGRFLLLRSITPAWATDEIDDSVKSQLVTTTKGLTDAIIAMSEDDIQGYLESEDAFTQSACKRMGWFQRRTW